jgi:hypothetical protein
MVGPLEQLNVQDKAQDIKLKRRFARFAYWTATVWMVFLVAMTFMQGLRDGYTFDFDYFVIRVPPFYLEQWAFVAAFTSSTGSIFGLAHIIGKYLYFNGAVSKVDNAERQDGDS